MVYYDWMMERWIDGQDESFSVDMTPDNDEPEFETGFEEQRVFWMWYEDENREN